MHYWALKHASSLGHKCFDFISQFFRIQTAIIIFTLFILPLANLRRSCITLKGINLIYQFTIKLKGIEPHEEKITYCHERLIDPTNLT